MAEGTSGRRKKIERNERGRSPDCHDNGSVPIAECLQLVQFIAVVSLFLSLFFCLSIYLVYVVLSVLPAHFHPPLCRGGFRGTMGEECPGGFCPSFVSSSNYDLSHEYEPYVNIRALSPPPSPVRPVPSFGRLFLPLSLSFFASSSFFSISPFLAAARTSFRAPWGCKCIHAMTSTYSRND